MYYCNTLSLWICNWFDLTGVVVGTDDTKIDKGLLGTSFTFGVMHCVDMLFFLNLRQMALSSQIGPWDFSPDNPLGYLKIFL